MESVKPSAMTPAKSKLARTFAKVLHIRAVSGVAPVDGVKKVKPQEKVVKDDQKPVKSKGSWSQLFDKDDKDDENKVVIEALLAKIFATISSVKAAYSQLQYAQSPYDAEGIQSADCLVVKELKNLSEFKQCYFKKQFDFSPEKTLVSAEIQELNSLLKTYEIMRKKLESQLRLKDSEIIFLREKLEEINKQNKLTEKRLYSSGQLSMLDHLHFSGLSPSHFNAVLRHAVKSIRGFVRLMIDEMKTAGWDIDAAANSIQPNAVYYKADHKCFAFESFVCREMFNAFHYPNYSPAKEPLPERKKQQQQQLFFERFTELKSVKAKDYLSRKSKSSFGKFCRVKYLQVIHPKMESSFFGNLNHRNLVNSGEFPDTGFFASFAEMAKRVWLLHCLAFSFQPEASIFQVNKGTRFSEVYMESLDDEAFLPSNNTQESDPRVAFTVVPGFRIGKTVLQCQVYLSQFQTNHNH
ncbi:protein GRAVITROPIC IN THE LIGHT 1 [Mangifera indica]|uniref:protein GRAVITROPIC IN THE LIGHT 1 n=1 Tax=Mangifera indica TaxID=29780 RepID=UPI001CF9B7C4|nr:protein GRAVITROPIC IN THE LIGHT 1 [Mangifera indica]XP_044508485.1 protein GRAVITROPIC IN THE LIGHT 1 [Mangifera indica]XP_044508495.1 protein GRAVITROPIC IN THE LIGHT 1 [Mangifera indica]XP_044508503.1 protein GRAVITROPIC IN THE LIGHT 1 [Mangifera indica]XP_044508511.1 protein GRAVITROPIC IN THE LIGHT 1 [Mangifera indica]